MLHLINRAISDTIFIMIVCKRCSFVHRLLYDSLVLRASISALSDFEVSQSYFTVTVCTYVYIINKFSSIMSHMFVCLSMAFVSM